MINRCISESSMWTNSLEHRWQFLCIDASVHPSNEHVEHAAGPMAGSETTTVLSFALKVTIWYIKLLHVTKFVYVTSSYNHAMIMHGDSWGRAWVDTMEIQKFFVLCSFYPVLLCLTPNKLTYIYIIFSRVNMVKIRNKKPRGLALCLTRWKTMTT